VKYNDGHVALVQQKHERQEMIIIFFWKFAHRLPAHSVDARGSTRARVVYNAVIPCAPAPLAGVSPKFQIANSPSLIDPVLTEGKLQYLILLPVYLQRQEAVA
jgi:hypothetical protein